MKLLPSSSAEAFPLQRALRERRSVREYATQPLTPAEVSQLLWAAQGATGPDGERTAPSAGALYPLEAFLVAGNVDGIAAGVYRYRPERHELLPIAAGDLRADLAAAALQQTWMRDAAALVALAAVVARTTRKYGARGERYVYMEVGHAAQNVHLAATALGLGTVVVGAFEDAGVRRLLQLPRDHRPLVLMPVGRLRSVSRR